MLLGVGRNSFSMLKRLNSLCTCSIALQYQHTYIPYPMHLMLRPCLAEPPHPPHLKPSPHP